MRTIIIGDIHGCLAEFELLLRELHFVQGTDRLILLGDLINKGPDSLGVLEKALELKCEVTLGNHEWGFIENAKNPLRASSYFSKLKQQMADRFDFWLSWMKDLPTFIEEEDFLVVHGGIVPGEHPKDSCASVLTRIRTWDGKGDVLYSKTDPAWFDLYKEKKLVVFGHWASKGLVERGNVIGLDTGCVYGKKLSALILPEKKIIQIKALKDYEKIVPIL